MSKVVTNQSVALVQNPQSTNSAYQKRVLPRPDFEAIRAHLETQGINEDNIVEITEEAIVWSREELRKERG